MIFSSGGITASRQLQSRIAKNIEAALQREIEIKNTQLLVPPHFIANHFAGSLLATIYWWLDNDLPYEVEQMASMFQKVNLLDRETLMSFEHRNVLGDHKNNKNKKRQKTKQKRDKEQKIDAGEVAIQEDVPSASAEQAKE